jgi:hypothetical protein
MPLDQYGKIKNTAGKESYLGVKFGFKIIINPNVNIIFIGGRRKIKNQKIQEKQYKWKEV